MGIVEEVGSDVRHVKPGDLVLAPFAISDGTCESCEAGLQTSCTHGGFWAGITDGAQGEAVRAPLADGTLVRVPQHVHDNDPLVDSLFPLTDVMGTGHHAAVCAGVGSGSTSVVIGDGAVGLSGVLAARRLGAERIIIAGHHADRLETARSFGATDVVTSRGDEAVEELLEMTRGGSRHVLECVGNSSAMETTIRIVRPGGAIDYVGVPHGPAYDGIDVMGLSSRTQSSGAARLRCAPTWRNLWRMC